MYMALQQVIEGQIRILEHRGQREAYWEKV
jgi:hypothetical protein